MFHANQLDNKVLLCTPDYPPKLGGLSTFSVNLEKVLSDLGIGMDLLVWESHQELKDFTQRDTLHYDWIIHIHGLSYQVLSRSDQFSNERSKHINFFHGSEILFKGRNFLYTLIKNLLKKSALRQFEKAHSNISISEFTLNKLSQLGYHVSYDRDFVIHNGIELNSNSKFIPKNIEDDTLHFICMARSVPHKNPEGAKDLMESCAKTTFKKVKLYSAFDLESNALFEHVNIGGISNVTSIIESDNFYEKLLYFCHFLQFCVLTKIWQSLYLFEILPYQQPQTLLQM